MWPVAVAMSGADFELRTNQERYTELPLIAAFHSVMLVDEPRDCDGARDASANALKSERGYLPLSLWVSKCLRF
jgi:hypothetical protein